MHSFSTKAQTLQQLLGKLNYFRIPPLISFEVADYQTNQSAVLGKIQQHFPGGLIAIRSSALDEDGAEKANAGEYGSVLGVDVTDRDALCRAINHVIDSYESKGLHSGKDEILAQMMVQNVSMSGVVFTHDLNTGAPYYVVNYDDISGLTNTVTSGTGEYANRTLFIHRGSGEAVRSERFRTLLRAVDELEETLKSQFLDIEFALDGDGIVYLLQVRAITTKPNWNRAVANSIDAELTGISEFLKSRFTPVTGVFGNASVFGQMPDWNPAEMIGRAPRALAHSLYRQLITDNAWRLARREMRYQVPMGHALMVSLAGQPFVDARLSFHSFLPPDLPVEISQKVVNTALETLRNHPELHDKIEFDVTVTSFCFDVDRKITKLFSPALTEAELSIFKEALRRHTVSLVTGAGSGGVADALFRIDHLAKRTLPKASEVPDTSLSRLYGMIDDCITYGTVPFSVLARHGFIARSLLYSLQARGLLTAEDVSAFMASIQTVAGELVADVNRLQSGDMALSEFMNIYGHLRPGTYEILSPRYDQMDSFLTPRAAVDIDTSESSTFVLRPDCEVAINRLLRSEGFGDFSAVQLFDYIREATVGREYAKFIFTRSISDMLEFIAEIGEIYGLTREEMSYVPIGTLLDLAVTSMADDTEQLLREKAREGEAKNQVSSAIRLPQILFDAAGVFVVPFQVSQPNFITTKQVSADAIMVSAQEEIPDLQGKIVLIEGADPGYDWIFAHNIAGLVTKYGGANSHMAIRCAEFGLPAAIGCGEQRFEMLKQAKKILLDCSSALLMTVN